MTDPRWKRLDERYQSLIARGADWYPAETLAAHAEEWLRRVHDVHPAAGRLAELGSGLGHVSLALARAGWDVVGFEVSPAAVAEANRRAEGISARFLVAAVGTTLLEAEPCDVVLDADCLHYQIGHERAKFWTNVARLLRPGGFFLGRTMVGVPEESTWTVLGYRPEDRIAYHGDLPLTYHAEAAEIESEISTAGLILIDRNHQAGSATHPALLRTVAVKPAI